MVLSPVAVPASSIPRIDHPSLLHCPDFSNALARPDSNAVVRRGWRCLALKASSGDIEKAGYEVRVSHNHKLNLGSLAEDGLSYKERFTMRSYEVGFNKTVTLQTIANFLQEVACNHFLCLGFSTNDGFSTSPSIRKFGLIWVTSRMHIEVYRYPTWDDVVEIETWGQCAGCIHTRRHSLIRDYTTGEVIGRATSNMLLLNQDTRRLQKVPDVVLQEILRYSPKQTRSIFPEGNSDCLKKIEKLDDPAEYSKLGLMPRRGDLDMNQHVNNVTYIGWILESVPQDIQLSHELQSLTLDYKRECRYGDVIDSFTSHESRGNDESSNIYEHKGTINEGIPSSEDDENDDIIQFQHLLRLSRNGLETNRGKTKWRKEKPCE